MSLSPLAIKSILRQAVAVSGILQDSFLPEDFIPAVETVISLFDESSDKIHYAQKVDQEALRCNM